MLAANSSVQDRCVTSSSMGSSNVDLRSSRTTSSFPAARPKVELIFRQSANTKLSKLSALSPILQAMCTSRSSGGTPSFLRFSKTFASPDSQSSITITSLISVIGNGTHSLTSSSSSFSSASLPAAVAAAAATSSIVKLSSSIISCVVS